MIYKIPLKPGPWRLYRAWHKHCATANGRFARGASSSATKRAPFTSAISRRRGKFEQANGGSIFLDEIGDMPLSTQAKMLRVLQERSFQRVGGEEKINVNVRVIWATNHDLEEAVKKASFAWTYIIAST